MCNVCVVRISGEREKGTEETSGTIMNLTIVKEHSLPQKYFRIVMGQVPLCVFCFSSFLSGVSVTIN